MDLLTMFAAGILSNEIMKSPADQKLVQETITVIEQEVENVTYNDFTLLKPRYGYVCAEVKGIKYTYEDHWYYGLKEYTTEHKISQWRQLCDEQNLITR